MLKPAAHLVAVGGEGPLVGVHMACSICEWVSTIAAGQSVTVIGGRTPELHGATDIDLVDNLPTEMTRRTVDHEVHAVLVEDWLKVLQHNIERVSRRAPHMSAARSKLAGRELREQV